MYIGDVIIYTMISLMVGFVAGGVACVCIRMRRHPELY